MFNDFTEDLWIELTERIDEAVIETPKPHYAAFDADGTLWNIDLGETFFKYQIANCQLHRLPANPWELYQQALANHSPTSGYLWLAQINEKQSIKTVREWADNCFRTLQPFNFFLSQKRLIDYLHLKNVEVFIVSGSFKWALEPAAKLFHIDHSHVLGMETEEVDGVLTTLPSGPLTWGPGKVEKLLIATKGKNPFLVCGNTMGDLELLRAATHIPFVVTSGDLEIQASEQELLRIARREKWLNHQFTNASEYQ